MVKNNFNQGNGTVSIGSITEGDNFQPNGNNQFEIIYTLFDNSTTPGTVQSVKSYRLHDLINGYVVDLTVLREGEPLVVVTINGRANTNSPYGLLYAILDVSDFNSVPAIISKKYFAHPSGYNFYPYSTVIDEGRDVIYTCGHSDDIITSSPVAWP